MPIRVKHFGYLVLLLLLGVNLLITGLLVFSAYSPYVQPVEHPVRSCFGLAFPIFLILNGLFLLFWLIIRQYKAALLPVLGFVVCYGPLLTYMPINRHTSNVSEKSIKLLSYNIMGFNNDVKTEEGNPILNYLKNSEADILCLQEYRTLTSSKKLTQKDIDQALKDYPYHNIQLAGEAKGNLNQLACYSKYPILSARWVDYDSQSNGSVAYELLVEGDTLLLINNHLESNKLTKADKDVYTDMLESPEKGKVKSGLRLLVGKLAEASALRAPQADSVACLVKRSRHKDVVVCGDFNDSPLSYAHHAVARHLDDAFRQSGCGFGISYNQNRFYFRIDHIFVSKNLKTYNCTVDRSIKDSDHYPVWCYIGRRAD